MERPDSEAVFKVKLSAAEALEVSLCLERTGVEFYRMMADEIKEEKLRNFFLGLSGMELEHEKKVRELIAAETDRPPGKLGFDETLTGREFFIQLKGLITSGAFPSGFEFFDKIDRLEKPLDALPLAMKIEEKSIKVFQHLIKLELSPAAKKTVGELIEDEKSHLEEVKKVYRRVKGA